MDAHQFLGRNSLQPKFDERSFQGSRPDLTAARNGLDCTTLFWPWVAITTSPCHGRKVVESMPGIRGSI
jgi:hypothetical protein